LKVNSPNLILGTGGSQTVSVEYLGKKKLTWSSSDKSVATVSSSGKVKAIKKGTATITVTDGTNKGTVKVTVAGCAGCMAASDGLSFNSGEQYMLSKALKANPLTFEAVFTVKKASLSESTTTILGSDNRYDTCTVFAINKDGQPKVIIRDSAANTTGKTYTFNKVNVATGQKVHLAITMDLKNRKMYCYVNGKLAQTLSSIKKVSSYKDKHNMVIGGDLRNGNATYFTGSIASIALWSDIRTASEISNDYKKGISTSDKNLLVAHDFTRCSSHKYTDKSSNKNDVKYVDLWLSKSQVKEVTDYEYSFAVIGDTQTMCEKDPDAMERIYDWLLDNKESKKISYVIGLGDITDDSTDGEWETASRVIGKLNGKIPYVLTRGNHDDWDDFNRNLHNGFYETTVDGMMKSGDISLTDPSQPGLLKKVNADGSVTLVTREEDIPEGGTVKGDLTNSYRYFSIQGTNYLIMTLDFAPSSATLNWAGSVIKAHPKHKVIIVTHAYMYRDGTTLDAGDCYPPSYYDGYTDAQNGDQMWAKCFSKYENVVMVLSGHDPWQHIVYRQDEGVNGNTVTQMLIDAQYVDLTGSTGMVAMLYFSDGGETVTVRYYSVEKDCYGSEQSQFTVHLNHEYKNVNTKATFKSNGEKAVKCSCGSKKSSKTIASVKSVTLSQTTFAYDGNKKTPSVTVKDSNGKKLKLNQDYTVKYSGGKAMGTYTVTVTLKGNYSGTKKLKFSILPKTVSGLKADMTTSSISLSWSKVKGATAYEVYQYSAKKKKYVKVATVKKNSYKVSKLSAGTIYSFKVRAYYSKDKTKITGNFSSVLETATKTKAPEFTKVTSTAKGKVSFAWTDVSGESRYQIYYSTKKDGEYTKLTDFKANKKSGSKSKLTSGKTYYFKIRTYKKAGKGKVYSSFSAVKSVRVK
ncbi:MAG: metallophosphoesterase, partial [Clostridia bacterium]|nr:metallophosphoesterase [Clostridia bacterium]